MTSGSVILAATRSLSSLVQTFFKKKLRTATFLASRLTVSTGFASFDLEGDALLSWILLASYKLSY